MPEITQAAPSGETASPAPVVVSTPVTPSPQASPGPRRLRPTPNATNTTTRTYGTGVDGAVRASKQVAASATPVSVPEPSPAPVASASEPEPDPLAKTEPAAEIPAAETPAAETPASTPETPAAEAAAETSEAPKLDDKETARRLAAIARADRKLAEDKRKFAEEKAKHATDMQRVEQMNNAQAAAQKDPIGFMNRVFGIKPQHIVDKLIEIQNRKPEDVAREREAERDQKIADLERQLQEGAKETKEQKTRREAQEYLQTTIVPLVSDQTKYKFLNHKHGKDTAAVIYNTMVERYNRTGTAPAPQAVADFFEKQYRDEAAQAAKLLGVSASPQPTANPKKVVAPAAKAQPATAQQPPVVTGRRARLAPKPYTTQVK